MRLCAQSLYLVSNMYRVPVLYSLCLSIDKMVLTFCRFAFYWSALLYPETLTEWNISGFSMIEFLLLLMLPSSAHSSNSSWAELALFSISPAEGLHDIGYGLHNITDGLHSIAYMGCTTLQMGCTTLQMGCTTLHMGCTTLHMGCTTLQIGCRTSRKSTAKLNSSQSAPAGLS
jgi:hypothetical protein